MPPQPLYIGQKAIFFAKLLFWVQLKVLLQLVANSFVFACDLTEASPGFRVSLRKEAGHMSREHFDCFHGLPFLSPIAAPCCT